MLELAALIPAVAGLVASLLSVARRRESIHIRFPNGELQVRHAESLTRHAAAEVQKLLDSESPSEVTTEEKSSIDETVAKARAQLDATLDTLDSLRFRIGEDVGKLRAQVDAERDALDKLSAQVRERKNFLEMSAEPAKLAEHLDAKISRQTELIEAQGSQVEVLQEALETMRRRAARAGRWNLVLTIALALVSTALGLWPILWA